MDDYESSFPPRSEKHTTNKKDNKNNKDNNEGSFLQEVFSTLKYILVLSVIFFVIHRFFFAPVMVDGDSMEPTLSDGDYLLLNKFSEIEHGDIVVFPPPDEENTQYIKRVIGMPGDTVEYQNDVLYLNGEAMEQDFLETDAAAQENHFATGDFSLLTLLGTEEVPEGQYFVLGDNRLNSRDSRSFGFIDEEAVLGEVSFRYWPLEDFGIVE
jgi:signal peptidase I